MPRSEAVSLSCDGPLGCVTRAVHELVLLMSTLDFSGMNSRLSIAHRMFADRIQERVFEGREPIATGLRLLRKCLKRLHRQPSASSRQRGQLAHSVLEALEQSSLSTWSSCASETLQGVGPRRPNTPPKSVGSSGPTFSKTSHPFIEPDLLAKKRMRRAIDDHESRRNSQLFYTSSKFVGMRTGIIAVAGDEPACMRNQS